MRFIVTTLASLLVVCANIGAVDESTPLHFVAAITDYYDTQYVQPPAPPFRHLYFTSETVHLRLSFGNRAGTPRILDLRGEPIDQAFETQSIAVPIKDRIPAVVPSSTGAITGNGTQSLVRWGSEIEIPARSSLTFDAELATQAAAAPGVFELRIVPRFRTAKGPLVLQGTVLRYELRDARDLGDRAEIVRRRIVHAYVHDDAAGLATATEELLGIYPPSALAYRMKGEIARQSGRTREAQGSFERALELITRGEDTLYVHHASPASVQRAQSELRTAIESLRAH